MDHGSYASPFSWRYGRAELRELFSERERRRLWRAVWVALARSQERSGLVSASEVRDLEAHANDVDIAAKRDAMLPALAVMLSAFGLMTRRSRNGSGISPLMTR